MNLEEEFYKLKPEFLKPFFQARQTTTILYLERNILMDEVAFIAATRFTRKRCVTVFV
jgi:hypothetical protein